MTAPTSEAVSAGRGSPFARHPWLGVVTLYGLSRLWSSGLLLAWFELAHDQGWRLGNAGHRASFAQFLNSWDGEFFLDIARNGYPDHLPLDGSGHALGGVWAFLPVFPFLVRALATMSSLPLDWSSVIVATLAGGAAATALHRLVALRVDARAALWATVLFCFGPFAFLLETGYSESLALFFVFAGLAALLKRQYALVAVFAALAAFTRPGLSLALAVAVAVHLVALLRARGADDAGGRAPRRRDVAGAVVAGLVAAAAGLAWSPIVGAVTGVPDGYVQTELAWWVSSVGRQPFVPLTPWFRMGVAYLGWVGPVVVGLALTLGVAYFVRRSLRRLGPEIIAYAASHCAYLVAVFLPQQSLFRLVLLPVAPLAADPALTAHPTRRRVALIACLALQPVAVVLFWCVSFP